MLTRLLLAAHHRGLETGRETERAVIIRYLQRLARRCATTALKYPAGSEARFAWGDEGDFYRRLVAQLVAGNDRRGPPGGVERRRLPVPCGPARTGRVVTLRGRGT